MQAELGLERFVLLALLQDIAELQDALLKLALVGLF
jgi:hypothetical protein